MAVQEELAVPEAAEPGMARPTRWLPVDQGERVEMVVREVVSSGFM